MMILWKISNICHGKLSNCVSFDDADVKFNLSALDVKGELLLTSQFYLIGQYP